MPPRFHRPRKWQLRSRDWRRYIPVAVVETCLWIGIQTVRCGRIEWAILHTRLFMSKIAFCRHDTCRAMPTRPYIWYKACKIDRNIKRGSVIVWVFVRSTVLYREFSGVALHFTTMGRSCRARAYSRETSRRASSHERDQSATDESCRRILSEKDRSLQ